jgi:hypothetical protein
VQGGRVQPYRILLDGDSNEGNNGGGRSGDLGSAGKCSRGLLVKLPSRTAPLRMDHMGGAPIQIIPFRRRRPVADCCICGPCPEAGKETMRLVIDKIPQNEPVCDDCLLAFWERLFAGQGSETALAGSVIHHSHWRMRNPYVR